MLDRHSQAIVPPLLSHGLLAAWEEYSLRPKEKWILKALTPGGCWGTTLFVAGSQVPP